MAPPQTDWGCGHLIAAYYSFIYPERLSRPPGWLTYSGRFTHISGHQSATGRAQDRECSPVKDQRNVPLCHATKKTCEDDIYKKGWADFAEVRTSGPRGRRMKFILLPRGPLVRPMKCSTSEVRSQRSRSQDAEVRFGDLAEVSISTPSVE